VTLCVPLANLFQASLAAKEYALKRQKMRQKAETIRFERMNQERKSADESKKRGNERWN